MARGRGLGKAGSGLLTAHPVRQQAEPFVQRHLPAQQALCEGIFSERRGCAGAKIHRIGRDLAAHRLKFRQRTRHVPGRSHQQPGFVLAAFAQQARYLLRVFARVARAAFEQHAVHFQPLLFVKGARQFRLAETALHQPPFAAGKHQCPVGMAAHQAHRQAHALGGFA